MTNFSMPTVSLLDVLLSVNIFFGLLPSDCSEFSLLLVSLPKRAVKDETLFLNRLSFVLMLFRLAHRLAGSGGIVHHSLTEEQILLHVVRCFIQDYTKRCFLKKRQTSNHSLIRASFCTFVRRTLVPGKAIRSYGMQVGKSD